MTKLPSEARLVLTRCLPETKGRKVISQINLWLKCSGPEWTSNRLKQYRVAAMQLRAGNPDIVKTIYKENSIRYNKATLIPKGPLGPLVENYVQSMRPSAIRRADAGLRIYTVIRLNTVSKTQLLKWSRALLNPPTATPRALTRLEEELYAFGERNKHHLMKLRDPNLSRLKSRSDCHRTIPVPKDIIEEAYAKSVTSLLSSVWIPEALQKYNPCEELRLELIKSGAPNQVAGRIAFIQEGGCKLRAVAIPNAWMQWLFEPVHLTLDNLIKSLPGSCVHDQNKGAYFLKEALRRGTVHCFDLSSATDRFPLQIQTALLRGLGLSSFALALEQASHGKWITPFDTEIHWETGQPMGLYSSFVLFHLSHLAVLEMIERNISKKYGAVSNTFMILGDDVIITDHKVASSYSKIMTELGVELSSTKTIQSELLGEFAGFVVTKTNRTITSYRPYKTHTKGTKSRAMNLMYALNSKCKSISPWWHINYATFVSTLSWRNPDLSPLLSLREEDGRSPGQLDSHLLGSLANRIAYDLPYELTCEFATLWRDHRYLLLGSSEVLNSDGFAPKNLNPDGIRNPLDDAHNKQLNQLESDPLFRERRDERINVQPISTQTTLNESDERSKKGPIYSNVFSKYRV